MPLPPPDVARLFTLGSRFALEQDGTSTIVELPVEQLALPSGQVCVGDPFITTGAALATVPPGRYPVQVALAEITLPDQPAPERPHLRVAAARLRVAEGPAVAWEMALHGTQDPATLTEPDAYFGYGVDAGTSCFVDVDSLEPILDYEDETEAVIEAFAGEDGERVHVVHVTEPADGHEIVAFSSGWGDGHYPTWLGRDADGTLVEVVTEFLLALDDRLPAQGLCEVQI